ncbi:putative phage abortive infection protein [Aureibaculum luteum]|uniref:putative phage abortive infection protein n=1 Tax=Aureibaculum luteum TaxID=1548456 RepID=UPI0013006248|nr:putative phage abortive infection protein [Aureibaculum luteum]
MDEINFEQEIKDTSERIQTRQKEIETELITLETKIKRYTNWAWGFVWTGIVLSVFSIFYYTCTNTEEGFGLHLLGDFLGGSVASLWALAGLFLIYVAFLGQKQQLLNQQLEIMYSQLEVKYTRLELAGQKREMILQNETLLNQKFENTFFQLLTLFNSIINSLDLRKRHGNTIIATGRDVFDTFNTSFIQKVRNLIGYRGVNESKIEEAIRAYNEVYDENKADLSHYFRTIYHIFKFIDDSKIENKKRYVSIARAQLSSYEQILLFYNCLHINGNEKFKPLIEKYAIFKNIDTSLLLNQEHLEKYKKGAYGK